MVVPPIAIITTSILISYKLKDRLTGRLVICGICNEIIEDNRRAYVYDNNYIHTNCRFKAILDFRMRFPQYNTTEVAEMFGVSVDIVRHASPRGKHNGFRNL